MTGTPRDTRTATSAPSGRSSDLEPGHDVAQDAHQVHGELRPGGGPAGAGEVDGDRVGGRGDGADPEADRPGGQLGLAVQAVDHGDVVEPAVGDDVQSAAGQPLLGRLEDQPHAATPRGQAFSELQDAAAPELGSGSGSEGGWQNS